MTENFEPFAPAKPMRMYFDERRHELADATIQSHRCRLKQFVQGCEQGGIDNFSEFTGRDDHRFRVKRRNEDEPATASMKDQLATLRIFLRFCATINAVELGLDEKIILPTTKDDARTELLNPDRVQKMLEFLDQYHYARLKRALMGVIWHPGFASETELDSIGKTTMATSSTSRLPTDLRKVPRSRTDERANGSSHWVTRSARC